MFESENWSVEDELSLDFSFMASLEKKQRGSEKTENVVKFESKLTFKGYSYTKKDIVAVAGTLPPYGLF